MNKHTRVWSLQDAKAKFSEVVRLAQTEGPQTVTVHGREAVIITSAEDKSARTHETGASLVELLEKSPLKLLGERELRRVRLPARSRPIDL